LLKTRPEVYRRVILTILERRSDEIAVKELHNACFLPTEIINETLKDLQREGLLFLEASKVKVSLEQKIKLALEAVKYGADIERVCRFVGWREFERIVTSAFSLNGYDVKRNFRFSCGKRRWEIDVLAVKKQTIVSADCKRWRRLSRSAVVEAVEKQVQRTKALKDALENLKDKLGLQETSKIAVVPLVISLYPAPMKFHDFVPVVPILQLASFLSELPANIHSLKHFRTV